MSNFSKDKTGKGLFVLGTTYPQVTGGMEIFNYYFLKFQLDTLKKSDYYCTTNQLPGHPKSHLRMFGLRPIRVFYPLQLFWILLRYRSRIKYVYTSYARQTWIIPFFSAFIYRLFGKPYIVTIHSGGTPIWKPGYPYRYYFKNADTLIGVSEAICTEYSSLLSGKKVHFIPPLIPFQHSEKSKDQLKLALGLSANSKVLLYVGSLKGMKNPDKVLKAFGIFKNKMKDNTTLKLVIAGGGPMAAALKQYAHENNLNNDVVFPGLVSRELVPDLFKLADYYIISSDYEGTSVSLMEAMYNKLPILAADSPGLNSMLQHERNALLYPAHDTDKLAECIEIISTDTFLANRLSNQGYTDFQSKYSYASMIDKYEQFFNIQINKAS